jgi:penicillin-binding protein 1C
MRRGRRAAAAVGIGLAALFALVAAAALGVEAAASRARLDPEAFRASRPRSTRIFDRNGALLREVADASGERAYFRPLPSISRRLVEAVIAAEDSSFRRHGGVDLAAATRALLSNLSEGKVVSGASTITMQLARVAFDQPRTFRGKLEQAFDALRLEKSLDKDSILEEYLNRVPFGGGRYGVEAACLEYLGKPAASLSLGEAALIAGLIQAPSLYDPARNPEGARRRRDYVLRRLLDSGGISRAAYAEALASPLPPVPPAEQPKAGHFTDYVLSLHPEEGDIETSLDWELEERIEAMVAAYVAKTRSAGLTNAAVVVLDNESSSVLAMVGSRGWRDAEGGAVNGATARRQPGSALKPFAYALAFERGYSPASMLADVETEYASSDRALYVPRNYSRSFRGPVLAKEALASSLNIPAIRLVRSVGLGDFLERLRATGFRSLDRGADYYGLGLVLGNGEVSALELAGAYATLARGGRYLPPNCLAPRLEQASGRDGAPSATVSAETQVYSRKAAWLVTSILSDETMRIQAFGSDSPLVLGFPMAIKTGTSGDWRDSWTVGYTAEFTIAVWGGDFESTPMNQISGSIGAGPLFNQVARLMAARLGRRPTLPEAPAGARKIVVCAESGDLPGPACPRRMVVSVCDDKERPQCTMHEFVTVDSRTGRPADDSTSYAFALRRLAYRLPPLFAPWLAESGKYSLPPAGGAAAGLAGGALSVKSPRKGDVYLVEPGYDLKTQTVELSAEAVERLPSVSWYVDGVLVAEAPWPYTASWPLSPGAHVVEARSGGAESPPVNFTVR